MASKNTPPKSEAAEQKPTPENTPVPGGGRWSWDSVNTCWVDQDAPVVDAIAADPTPIPTQPE